MTRSWFTLVNGWPHFESTLHEHLMRFDEVVRQRRQWDPVTVSRFRQADGTSTMSARLTNGITISISGYQTEDEA